MAKTRMSKEYKCPNKDCGESFNNRMSKSRHLKTCDKEKLYPRLQSKPIEVAKGLKCSTCERTYSHSASFSRHRKTCSQILKRLKILEDPSLYKCAKCNKSFQAPCKLKRHIATHDRRRSKKTRQSESSAERSQDSDSVILCYEEVNDEEYFHRVLSTTEGYLGDPPAQETTEEDQREAYNGGLENHREAEGIIEKLFQPGEDINCDEIQKRYDLIERIIAVLEDEKSTNVAIHNT